MFHLTQYKSFLGCSANLLATTEINKIKDSIKNNKQYKCNIPKSTITKLPTAQSSTWLSLQFVDTATYIKPRTRTKFGGGSFRFAGPDTWNGMPSHLIV